MIETTKLYKEINEEQALLVQDLAYVMGVVRLSTKDLTLDQVSQVKDNVLDDMTEGKSVKVFPEHLNILEVAEAISPGITAVATYNLIAAGVFENFVSQEEMQSTLEIEVLSDMTPHEFALIAPAFRQQYEEVG